MFSPFREKLMKQAGFFLSLTVLIVVKVANYKQY